MSEQNGLSSELAALAEATSTSESDSEENRMIWGRLVEIKEQINLKAIADPHNVYASNTKVPAPAPAPLQPSKRLNKLPKLKLPDGWRLIKNFSSQAWFFVTQSYQQLEN